MSCIGGHPVTAIESTQILIMLQELRLIGEIETLHKLLSATTLFFCYVMITLWIQIAVPWQICRIVETGKSSSLYHRSGRVLSPIYLERVADARKPCDK